MDLANKFEEKNEEDEKKDTEKIELLEYLFDFIRGEKLNYVLSGYFSKFFTNLINKSPNVIIKYLYSKQPDTLKCFLNHMNIKAISDLIPKLILNSMDSSMIMTNFQASNDSDNQVLNRNQNQNEYKEIRNELITKLFLTLNLENDIETTNNIVNICIELMENKTLLEFITNDEVILGSLFKSLSINLNEKENRNLSSYNYKEILVLVLNLLRFSLIEGIKLPNLLETSEDIVNFNCSLDQNKIKNTQLGKLIIENISHILQNFLFEKEEINNNTNTNTNNDNENENDFSNETTFGVKARPLGYKR
jgi:hypothetical protein